jgi:hypothetical protein
MPEAGTYNIDIIVDASEEIDEALENNNRLTAPTSLTIESTGDKDGGEEAFPLNTTQGISISLVIIIIIILLALWMISRAKQKKIEVEEKKDEEEDWL